MSRGIPIALESSVVVQHERSAVFFWYGNFVEVRQKSLAFLAILGCRKLNNKCSPCCSWMFFHRLNLSLVSCHTTEVEVPTRFCFHAVGDATHTHTQTNMHGRARICAPLPPPPTHTHTHRHTCRKSKTEWLSNLPTKHISSHTLEGCDG